MAKRKGERTMPEGKGGSAKQPIFDVAGLRGEVAKRWESSALRQHCKQRLRQFAATAVPGGPPGMRVSKLEMLVLDALDEVQNSFDDVPWKNTLKIVSYDLPITAAQAESWIEQLVAGKENADARARILDAVPRMRDHPETERYMSEMILPFRSLVVSQVAAALLDSCMAGEAAADNREAAVATATVPSEGDMNEGSVGETKPKPTKRKHTKLYPCHVHAAHHARDIDDVFSILSFVPRNAVELRQLVQAHKRNRVCTRFAEYNLFYMTATEEAGDEEWYRALLPLASDGLAHAQYDVAQCCLALRREEEGLAWLERAAKMGHSRAMLGVAKLHLMRAFGSVKYGRAGARGNGDARVKRSTDENTRAALKWLDLLGDADWDETTTDDIAEGQKLLKHLEKEAAAAQRSVEAQSALVSAKRHRRFLLWFGAFVLAALAIWSAASRQTSGFQIPLVGGEVPPRVPGDDGPTHNSKYVRSPPR